MGHAKFKKSNLSNSWSNLVCSNRSHHTNFFWRLSSRNFTWSVREYFVSYIPLTHSMPLVSFNTPENIRKPEVFWCFQGVSKETSGLKWVNACYLLMLSSWKLQVCFKATSLFNNTHIEEFVLYWIQYKKSLKYKVGCFWSFSYVYTIKFF